VVAPNDVLLVRLPGGLWHDAVEDIDQFLRKISFYSELCRGGQPKRRSIPHVLLGAGWAFFRSYVLRLGFLEGWRGLLISHCEAQGSFFKHMKRYVDAKTQRSAASSSMPSTPWPVPRVAPANDGSSRPLLRTTDAEQKS
jgi:hypothetical protein